MKPIRNLILMALILLAGCSQPSQNAPALEPQFGTAEDDFGTDVASVSTGRIYSLSKELGYDYAADNTYGKVLLRRFDGSGNSAWTRDVSTSTCNEYFSGCQSITPRSLELNSQGYVFALYSTGQEDVGDCGSMTSNYISKFDALGQQVAHITLPYNGRGPTEESPADYSGAIGLSVDGSGNLYVAQQKAQFDEDYCSATRTNVVEKFSPTGTLLWQRTSTVGIPYDITVSSTGSVYVVGTTGVARYSSSGGLTWSKAVNNSTGILENAGDIDVSGSYIYTRSGKDIRKWDGTGKQLWLRTQGGLNTIVVQDVDGDGSGNLYVSGKYDADARTDVVNMNAYVRKLSTSGSIVWTKLYGTPAYDDARGVATITGSEIYTTGETQGSLAHTNIGGRDGYLRKQNSTGGLVWNR